MLTVYSDAEQKLLEAARARRAALPKTPLAPQSQSAQKSAAIQKSYSDDTARIYRLMAFDNTNYSLY